MLVGPSTHPSRPVTTVRRLSLRHGGPNVPSTATHSQEHAIPSCRDERTPATSGALDWDGGKARGSVPCPRIQEDPHDLLPGARRLLSQRPSYSGCSSFRLTARIAHAAAQRHGYGATRTYRPSPYSVCQRFQRAALLLHGHSATGVGGRTAGGDNPWAQVFALVGAQVRGPLDRPTQASPDFTFS